MFVVQISKNALVCLRFIEEKKEKKKEKKGVGEGEIPGIQEKGFSVEPDNSAELCASLLKFLNKGFNYFLLDFL